MPGPYGFLSNFDEIIDPTVSFLNGAGVANGAALDNGRMRSLHQMAVTTGVGVTAGSVQLQGSFDGINWFAMGTPVSTTTASTTTGVSVQAIARFVRAAIATGLTGGTASASVVSL